jgi:MtrB/PioB family decaheme-associated outer membrane protein
MAWGLEFKVNFTNENKEGLRHWSRFAAAEFMAEPIDWTTRQLDATLNYAGEKLQLSGGYVGSWFEENGYNLVCGRTSATSCTDTAGSPFSGGVQDPAFLSLPFDNQAHQAFLSGAYRFTPTTQGTFKASYTHATVDEPIPTASLSAGTLFTYWNAPTHFDGEVNTTLVQLGLTARPIPKLNVLANLRYHDVDDQTPRYDVVGTNPSPGVATSHSTPLSYSTISGKLEGTYSLPQGYSVIAGIDYSDQDRTVPVGVIDTVPDPDRDTERYVPFRADLEEVTYRLQLRKSLSETLNGSVAYLRSDRDGSDFSLGRNTNGNIDQIAPLHIADRERDKIRLTADWAPMEALSVQLNLETSKDDYGMSAARPHGVHEGKANVYSVDVGYRLSENWQTSQTGRAAGTTTDSKDATQKDTGNAVGLNLTGTISPKLKVGADLSWIREKSSIEQRRWVTATGAPVVVAQVPDITSKATRINLFGQYALNRQADLRLDLIHERWKSDDWTWFFSDGSNFQYGTTTDGTTVIVDPKQNATFAGIRYIYKFQ